MPHRLFEAQQIARARNLALLLGGLAALIFIVFRNALDCGFINYDDRIYVADNRFVAAGLTAKSVRWALTAFFESNWHPLTWLSLMLDASIFGVDRPAGFHFTNLVLHAGNACLILLALRRTTGSTWRSALAASLFAIHPLRVESVVWVTERKDVLSTFLGLLALHAYIGHARVPGFARLGLALLLYALSLAAKPMLVTFPLLLLLLDLWPLGRAQEHHAVPVVETSPDDARPPAPQVPSFPLARILLEKLPFALLAFASCVVTLHAARVGGAIRPMNEFGLGARLGNALVAAASYLGMTIWPHDLALIYPLPPYRPVWMIATSAAVLLAISLVALRTARRWPHLAFGWLWYIIALLPVVGIVHVGLQSMADRYTYVPGIGLAIALVWSLPDPSPHRIIRLTAGTLAAAGLITLGCATQLQITHWHSAATIAARTLAVTTDNFLAHNLLGAAMRSEGMPAEAAQQFRISLRIRPSYAIAHANLADAERDLDGRDRRGQAEIHLRRAQQLAPGIARFHSALADLLVFQGRLQEAETQYRKALECEPWFAEAANNLGVLLEKRGRASEALPLYEQALRYEPEYASANRNLGLLLMRLERYDEAIAHFEAVLRAEPDDHVTRRRIGLADKLRHAPPVTTTEPSR